MRKVNLLSFLASHQLINRIEQFLETNETPYFMKSMDCITVFREEAIQVTLAILACLPLPKRLAIITRKTYSTPQVSTGFADHCSHRE